MGQLQTGKSLFERVVGTDHSDTAIKIYYADQKCYTIEKEMVSNCTVGWILSEVIRQVRADFGEGAVQKHFTYKHIVGLKMRGATELLDYWLTQYERPMLVPRNSCDLELIYSDYVQSRRIPQLSDFEIIKVIGKGGFSKVLQVRKKDSGMIYAMKVISKNFVMQKGKAGQIMLERRIMARLNHPFIVRLHYAFQSRHYLFLILDFCPGGELFYHLHNKLRFPEEIARFYFAEILLAVEYLHNQHVVYRDLKPENVLFDIDGHLKLTDFGLSKENFTSRSRSYSFCGSPEYMSPEMLSRKGHGLAIDCYSLGAILYEMLTGLPPHYSKNRQQMYQRIIESPVTYPEYLSDEVVSLLDRLLRKNPKERLTASEIKRHPFLSSINWEQLLQRKIRPPYELDQYVSHFDPEYTGMRVSWTEGDDSHEANYRSQSLLGTCQDFNTDSAFDSSNDSETTMIAAKGCFGDESETVRRKRNGNRSKSKKRANANNLFEMVDMHTKNWKANFELFLGYPYSREQLKPKSQSKAGIHKEEGTQASPKKAFSIKAVSIRGESNEQDVAISDSDSSGEEADDLMPALLPPSGQQRCASTDSLRVTHKLNSHVAPAKLRKRQSYKEKASAEGTQKRAKFAQYETCKLIKEEQSNALAGIIKLNDELNGVVSERKRKPNDKLQTRPKQTVAPHSRPKTHHPAGASPTSNKAPVTKAKCPAVTNKRKSSIATRNSQSEEVSGWTADSQLNGNGNEVRIPLAMTLSSRRMSTNPTPNLKRRESSKKPPQQHPQKPSYKFNRCTFPCKNLHKFNTPNTSTILRKQAIQRKTVPKGRTLSRQGNVAAKKVTSRINLYLDIAGPARPPTGHIIRTAGSVDMTAKGIHLNIVGNVKIENHIIIVPDLRGVENENGCVVQSATFRSVLSSPKSPAKVRRETDEGTDLDTTEIQEHTCLFTPPNNPKIRMAYFSQRK